MPPLFFIHGMWSRPTTFATLRQELAAAGCASFAPTLPGHDVPPGSPPPAGLGRLRLHDYVGSLRRDFEALGTPAILVGHSLGGLLAQLLAADIGAERVRGMVLLATAPSAQAHFQASSLSSIKAVIGMMCRWGWWSEPTKPSPEVVRESVFNGVNEEEARHGIAEITWDSGAVLAQISAPFLDLSHGSRVAYGRCRQPALVIAGSEDRIVPATVSRATARLLAAAGAPVDFEMWPGVGHWLFHDAVRPRLAAALTRFAASLG